VSVSRSSRSRICSVDSRLRPSNRRSGSLGVTGVVRSVDDNHRLNASSRLGQTQARRSVTNVGQFAPAGLHAPSRSIRGYLPQ